jgi:hypothetical protein
MATKNRDDDRRVEMRLTQRRLAEHQIGMEVQESGSEGTIVTFDFPVFDGPIFHERFMDRHDEDLIEHLYHYVTQQIAGRSLTGMLR